MNTRIKLFNAFRCWWINIFQTHNLKSELWSTKLWILLSYCISSAFGSARPFFLFLTAPIQLPVWAAQHPHTFCNTDCHSFLLASYSFPPQLGPSWCARQSFNLTPPPLPTPPSIIKCFLCLFFFCYTDHYCTKTVTASWSNSASAWIGRPHKKHHCR